MDWLLCLSINACILSYANALWKQSESEEHGFSQQYVLALRENLDQPEIKASSNNGNDRLNFLERELQKVKEENTIFRGHLSNLEEMLKQFQIDNLDVSTMPIKSSNGTMKLAKAERNDVQTKTGMDGILSRSPGTRGNLEGLDDRGPVAFFAQLTDSLTGLGMYQIIHFNYVVTNIGGGYNPHLGIFVAPVKGLYVFHVRVMVSPKMRQYVSIVKDGSRIQPLYPDASETQDYVIDSVTIVLEINKGSAVWVRAESGSGYLHGNKYSVFSGWLLSQL